MWVTVFWSKTTKTSTIKGSLAQLFNFARANSRNSLCLKCQLGHFYSDQFLDFVLRESLLWNDLLSKSIIFCVWPAGFSSVLLTRKPLNIAWLVSLHKNIRLTWAPKIAGHGCALSVPCATTICSSTQKAKEWFNSVSRNWSCSALDLQLQNGGDRFGQLSCPGIYFAQYIPLQNNSCKLFTRALFSIGLWNSSGRSNRLAFTPQKSVHVWQKEKVWKLPFCCFCSSKKLDSCHCCERMCVS